MQDPVHLAIMDVDSKVRTENLQEVTSTFIRESSSQEFHPQGLYSELIFGQVASPERLIRHGYINLRTKIIHPRIYKILTRLKGLYSEIMSGKAYAIFDEEEGDFVRASENDKQASTGYSFFTSHLNDIKFGSSPSLTRTTKIEVLTKYKKILLMSKCLVLPAGLRDMRNEDGRDVTDDINKIYTGIVNLSRAMPLDGTTSTMYDTIRHAIQLKVVEVYDYIHDIISDKTGFLQKKYGARSVALGTRNVISAADMAMPSPTSPQYIKADETGMPLYQAMKALQPLVSYQLKFTFFNPIFNDGAARVSVIDPKTMNLVYIDMTISEKDKFLTSSGIVDIITSYRDTPSRHNAVTVRDIEGKPYYLMLTYRDGDDVYYVRSKRDIETGLKETGKTFIPENLKPMTRAEMFYTATYLATQDKFVTVTRYPITGAESIYPSRIHLLSTTPSDVITLRHAFNPGVQYQLPHFPRRDTPSVDSATLHPSRLAGLGGDHDGDTVTINAVLAIESIKECGEHLDSPGSVVSAGGGLSVGISTEVAQRTFYNLSRRLAA